MLAKYRVDGRFPAWPTTRSNRTIARLHAAADDIASAARRKAAEKATRQRAKRLAAVAADPSSTLRETEGLVAERTTQAYRQVARMLADFSEALSASGRSNLAEEQAKKLKAANPKLRLLISKLRRHCSVPK